MSRTPQKLPLLSVEYHSTRGRRAWTLCHRVNEDWSIEARFSTDSCGDEVVTIISFSHGDEKELITDEEFCSRRDQIMEHEGLTIDEATTEVLDNAISRDSFRSLVDFDVEALIADMIKRWEAIKLLVTPCVLI